MIKHWTRKSCFTYYLLKRSCYLGPFKKTIRGKDIVNDHWFPCDVVLLSSLCVAHHDMDIGAWNKKCHYYYYFNWLKALQLFLKRWLSFLVIITRKTLTDKVAFWDTDANTLMHVSKMSPLSTCPCTISSQNKDVTLCLFFRFLDSCTDLWW